MSTSTIVQLSQLISQSVQTIERTCAANGTTVPDLDALFNPQSEAFRFDPAIGEAVNTATAAAYQLAAILEPPPVSVSHIAAGHYKSAALRALLETNTIEILREAGPEGLHVDKIGEQSSIDPKKLARLLRYLSTYHVFREVKPDVFTNTRISSVLDTGKSVKDLLEKPQERHENTPGFAALIEHTLDEVFKSSSCALEILTDPKTRLSGEPKDAPFNKAFNTEERFWTFLEQPDQVYRRRRFGVAMQGVATMQPADAILTGFKWKELTKNDTIVDVGAGVGAVSLVIAKANPDVNIVIQDLPGVISQAKELWTAELPDAINSGRVKLEVHDFMEPQSQKSATVFLLKQVDLRIVSVSKYAVKILSQLRASALENTKLLLVESLVPYACHDPSSEGDKAIPGAVPREAPNPLLANYGPINDMQYNSDFTMFFLMNAQERTVGHYKAILKETGWRIVRVYRSDGMSAFLQQVEAVPSDPFVGSGL